MTPERKAWWDSLPKEEKRVRQIYRYTKKEILNFTDHDKKYVIKALRKQIAMRPITKRANGDDYRKCPHCGRYLWRIEEDIYYDYPPKYCEDCGQKLRWA